MRYWRSLAIGVCSFLFFFSLAGCNQSHQGEIPDSYRIRIGTKEFSFQQQLLYVMLSLEMYRLHVGAYPNRENNLEALIHPPDILEASGEWRGPYAATPIVFGDPWGRRLIYQLDERGKADLRSLGNDGIPSDDDLIAKDLFPDIFRELGKLPQIVPDSIATPIPSPPDKAVSNP